MISILWALSSMLVLFLIISFLPLGFTIKGKLFIAVISFLFALVALAAVVSFPLWQTALMLVPLIFLTAYFMSKRMGSLKKDNPHSLQEEWKVENIYTLNNLKPDNLNQADPLFESAEISIIEGVSEVNVIPPVSTQQLQINDSEEDISFLLEREIEIKMDEQQEEAPKVGYLSEIESLLEEELVDEKDQVSRDWLEEWDDLLPVVEVAATSEIEEKKITLQK